MDVVIHANCLLTLFDNLSEQYGIFLMHGMGCSLYTSLSGTLPYGIFLMHGMGYSLCTLLSGTIP
jgi:hypothetical protein